MHFFGTAENDNTDAHSTRMNHQADYFANESPENVSRIKRKSSKRNKRMRPNIVHNLRQLNAPLNLMSLPDDLTLKFNFISGDTGASNRLFITVLPTKNSTLQLNRGEKFIDPNIQDDILVVRNTRIYFNIFTVQSFSM